MSIKLVKTFNQSQILAMTPSLRKSIELLQLSKFELLEEIKHHQDENPFIKNINENEEVNKESIKLFYAKYHKNEKRKKYATFFRKLHKKILGKKINTLVGV